MLDKSFCAIKQHFFGNNLIVSCFFRKSNSIEIKNRKKTATRERKRHEISKL